ncbi:MAG: hypothetical protein ACJASB_003591 [Shewanella psychromarinicola]|jgi:hypothetical protein
MKCTLIQGLFNTLIVLTRFVAVKQKRLEDLHQRHSNTILSKSITYST